MTTKQDIDNYFTQNSEKVLLAITKTKNKYRSRATWEAAELLSATYEYLIQNIDKIGDNPIESFVMRYMSNQIRWTKSTINKIDEDKKSPI